MTPRSVPSPVPPAVTVSAVDDDLVTVTGELDASAGPVVRPAVLDMVAACVRARAAAEPGWWSRAAVLDLSAVTFAASAGLSLLLELDARASAKKVPLTLVVAPGGALARILDRTGLSMVLTVSSPAPRFGWFDEHGSAGPGRD